MEKIDTNKLGISNLSVSTRKDARKAKKLISDAIEYISKVKGNLGNRMNSLEEIKEQKADPGYAFDIVNDGKKSEQTEKMDIDGVINSKFAIENGILDKALKNAEDIIEKLVNSDVVQEQGYTIKFEVME